MSNDEKRFTDMIKRVYWPLFSDGPPPQAGQSFQMAYTFTAGDGAPRVVRSTFTDYAHAKKLANAFIQSENAVIVSITEFDNGIECAEESIIPEDGGFED